MRHNMGWTLIVPAYPMLISVFIYRIFPTG